MDQLSSHLGRVRVADEPNYARFVTEQVLGSGSFGVVFKAVVQGSGEVVAIKKVLQDQRFKNRELQILRMLSHPNVVGLKHCFYSQGDEADEEYLNLVMDFVPQTLHAECRRYAQARQPMPMLHVKLYTYQLLRALHYIHSLGVCHRDIKPQNLLVDPSTLVLRLCDFGSAKMLVAGEPNVSYICSRYYRAPELIFGATQYQTSIDVWSAGCVMAEMLLGEPLFPGQSSVDQLVEVIKVLGTPSRSQVHAMNPSYTDFAFPEISPHEWHRIFDPQTPPEAIDLLSRLVVYEPNKRLAPLQACLHPFFDELRLPATRLAENKPLPPLFDFSRQELDGHEHLGRRLIPPHERDAMTPQQRSELQLG